MWLLFLHYTLLICALSAAVAVQGPLVPSSMYMTSPSPDELSAKIKGESARMAMGILLEQNHLEQQDMAAISSLSKGIREQMLARWSGRREQLRVRVFCGQLSNLILKHRVLFNSHSQACYDAVAQLQGKVTSYDLVDEEPFYIDSVNFMAKLPSQGLFTITDWSHVKRVSGHASLFFLQRAVPSIVNRLELIHGAVSSPNELALLRQLFPAFIHLKEVDLFVYDLTVDLAMILRQQRYSLKTLSLRLEGALTTGALQPFLLHLGPMPELTTLRLHLHTVDTTYFLRLYRPSFPKVRILELQENILTTYDVRLLLSPSLQSDGTLAADQPFDELEVLDLSQNRLDDRVIPEFIKASSRLAHLRSLKLEDNRISGKGVMQVIQNVHKFPSLVHVLVDDVRDQLTTDDYKRIMSARVKVQWNSEDVEY